MDFNIEKYIKKLKEKSGDSQTDIVIIQSLLRDYNINLELKYISFKRGILSFKKISPSAKTYLKIHQKEFIQKMSSKKVVIRTIM